MPKKNNLPHWKEVQKIIKSGKTKEALDFVDIKRIDGTLSRTNARYRLAKSFTDIKLEGYSKRSTMGYSSIIRAFLVYSALESYLKLVSKDKNKCHVANLFIDTNKAKKLSDKILDLDKDKKFYTFISDHSTRKNIKTNIEDFYNNKEHNVVCLLSAMRHIFTHGILTPHANHASPTKVAKICNLLSDFFLSQIEQDFAKRIQRKK